MGGLCLGGLISRIIYSLANGWAYIRGGALTWDFTGYARQMQSDLGYNGVRTFNASLKRIRQIHISLIKKNQMQFNLRGVGDSHI